MRYGIIDQYQFLLVWKVSWSGMKNNLKEWPLTAYVFPVRIAYTYIFQGNITTILLSFVHLVTISAFFRPPSTHVYLYKRIRPKARKRHDKTNCNFFYFFKFHSKKDWSKNDFEFHQLIRWNYVIDHSYFCVYDKSWPITEITYLVLHLYATLK